MLTRRVYIESSEYNLFKCLKYFTDYKFFEKSHTYTYKGQPVQKSVTQFVDTFVSPFDEEKWLPKKAKERGITPEELKAEWNRTSLISTTTGTLFHKFMEESISGKHFEYDFSYIDTSIKDIVYNRYNKLTCLGEKFISDTKEYLIPVKSEFIVGHNTEIAGQLDQLFYNCNTNSLDIYDWKTNKDIRCWNKWHKTMLSPFSNLDECELNSYSLQLSSYKALLQNVGVCIGNLNIVWFNENNKSYQIMQCKDLTDKVRPLLFK